MNIFFLSNDPNQCSIYHNDKHVVKMILESAQLLDTSHYVLDGHNINYRPTHMNHPCSKWVRESSENYQYLFSLLYELTKEYTHRYGKIHAVDKLLLSYQMQPKNIHKTFMKTSPALAMPEQYKIIGNPIQSYRNYYIGEKQHIARWKNRNPPEWYIFK